VVVRKDEYLSKLACPEWYGVACRRRLCQDWGGWERLLFGAGGFEDAKRNFGFKKNEVDICFLIGGQSRQELLCARLKFRLVAAHECTYKSIAKYYDQLNPYDRK
jgi:hypothetical protein